MLGEVVEGVFSVLQNEANWSQFVKLTEEFSYSLTDKLRSSWTEFSQNYRKYFPCESSEDECDGASEGDQSDPGEGENDWSSEGDDSGEGEGDWSSEGDESDSGERESDLSSGKESDFSLFQQHTTKPST